MAALRIFCAERMGKLRISAKDGSFANGAVSYDVKLGYASWPNARPIVQHHRLKCASAECGNICAALGGDRQHRFGEPKSSVFDLERNVAEVAGDLGPSLIECFANGPERFRAKRGSVDQSTRFHSRL